MVIYKNTSATVKTFYDVKFGPGEAHEVPGYINDTKMIRVYELPKHKVESVKVSKPKQAVNKEAAKEHPAKATPQAAESILENKHNKEDNPNGSDNNK